MNKCSVCNKETENNVCEDCMVVVKAIYCKYSAKQIMALFSSILGSKIVQEISEAMLDSIKDQYISDLLKQEGRIN